MYQGSLARARFNGSYVVPVTGAGVATPTAASRVSESSCEPRDSLRLSRGRAYPCTISGRALEVVAARHERVEIDVSHGRCAVRDAAHIAVEEDHYVGKNGGA